ncbi:hypothetical protein MCEGE10_02629 [Flavobacteriaceae bacterium]
MSNIINCPSCGAVNQLPEGKDSMFCAFCGGSVAKIETNKNHTESVLKFKPEISQRKTINESKPKYDEYSPNLIKYVTEETVVQEGGELSLINREIKTIDEVTNWFSDNELNEVIKLNLSKNKIIDIRNIERFSNLETIDLSQNKIIDFNSLKNLNILIETDFLNLSNNNLKTIRHISNFKTSNLNLSNNQLTVVDDINQLIFEDIMKGYRLVINLSNNTNLKAINENVFEYLNKFSNQMVSLELNLIGCGEFDLNCLSNLNLNIIKTVCFIHIDNNLDFPNELKEQGFLKFSNEHMPKNGTTWRYRQEAQKHEQLLNENLDETTEGTPKWVAFLFPIFVFGGIIEFLNGKEFLGILTILFFGGGGLLLYLKKD